MIIQILAVIFAVVAVAAILMALRLTMLFVVAGCALTLAIGCSSVPEVRGALLSALPINVSGRPSPQPVDQDTARFRLEVSLVFNGTPLTASVVQETYWSYGSFFGAETLVPDGKGDALVLVLPGRGDLIALLDVPRGPEYWYLYPYACGLVRADGESLYDYKVRLLAHDDPCIAPSERMPLFVYLPSERSAEGMQIVAPDQFPEVLNATLASVRFVKTEEPLSTGIESRLRWLSSEPKFQTVSGREIERGAFHRPGRS